MVKIFRKDGWQLNTDDLVVNGILKMLEKNNGECPCKHTEDDGDIHCPCDSYKLKNKCYCSLYVRK